MTAERRQYRIDEFCRNYGVGKTTAFKEIREGRLRAVKLGRRTLIPADAAELWAQKLPESYQHGYQHFGGDHPRTIATVSARRKAGRS